MKKTMLILLVMLVSISFAIKGLPNPGDFKLLTIDDKPKEWVETDSFSKVVLNGKYNVILVNSDKVGYSLDAEEVVRNNTDVNVKNNVLSIEYSGIPTENTNDDVAEIKSEWVNIFLFHNNLKSFELYGEIIFPLADKLNSENIAFDIQAKTILNLKGKADKALVDVKTSGIAEIKMTNFAAREMNIINHGEADIYVNVKEVLEVEIAGKGNVYYKGKPDKINESITGNGKLEQIK